MKNPDVLRHVDGRQKFACEIVHREGGGLTALGLTPMEAVKAAFEFLETKPRNTYVYITEPYEVFPSERHHNCYDTTAPESIRKHRDVHASRKSKK